MSENQLASQATKEEESVLDENPTSFNPQRDEEEGPELSRQHTLLERVQTSYSFFNQNLRSARTKMVWSYLKVYLIMAVGVLSLFSIYWGSMYKRYDRMKNLQMLVVIEDQEVDGVEPIIGNTLQQALKSSTAHYHGTWNVYNTTEFQKIAARHNNENDIEAEVRRQIHQQNYWSALYVAPNASYNFQQAIISGNTSYSLINSSVASIYETGRDFLAVPSYIVPGIEAVEHLWLQQYAEQVKMTIYNSIDNKTEVLSNADSLQVFSASMGFQYVDMIPLEDPVLLAPSQVGLIYMIIVTFFNFNLFATVHQMVAGFKIKKHHFLLYRVLSSVLSFFVLSLFYSLVTLAFQVDFNKAYGKSGFLVYWMTAFLTMWAVGNMNEIAGMLCVMSFPPLLGFWMLFWVISNISPTFAPMVLSAKFFRYGYAMPIHNSYEATKVIFFNTTKRQLGRNYAVLVIWVVLSSIALAVVTVFFGKTMSKRAILAKKEQEAQFRAKLEAEGELRH